MNRASSVHHYSRTAAANLDGSMGASAAQTQAEREAQGLARLERIKRNIEE